LSVVIFSPFSSCKLLNGFKNDFNFFVNSTHYIGKADKCECDNKASMKVQYVVNRRYRRPKGMVQNQYMCLIMTVRVFTYYNGNERMRQRVSMQKHLGAKWTKRASSAINDKTKQSSKRWGRWRRMKGTRKLGNDVSLPTVSQHRQKGSSLLRALQGPVVS